MTGEFKLNHGTLRAFVLLPSAGIDDHPATHFVAGSLCRLMIAEFDDQAIPTHRLAELQRLNDPIEAALDSPDDVSRLDALVRIARQVHLI